MTRALLWKELRMQRPVLFAGAVIAALGPILVLAMLSADDRYGYWDIVRGLRTVLAAAWPFLGVAAGAITFATEAEDGTARFLLSRPVSRARVWCVKVGAAAATMAATGLLSLLAIRLVVAVVGSPPADFVARAGYDDWTLFVSSTVLGLGLLFFACGVFCSTVLTRPLTAAAAAVAVGLAVLSAALLLWSVMGLTPHLEPQWLGVEVILLSTILIAASLLVFVWPEQFGRGAALNGTGHASIASAAVLVLLAVAVPMAFVALTPGVDEVTAVPGSMSYNGESVAMAMRDATGTTQNWLLMTDGSGARPLTGRYTMAPQWPSGRTFVAYYSQRGAIGNAGSRLDLRMTDILGSMSWTVFRGMPGVRELFSYSPGRNGSVAFTNGSEIIVARMNGYGHESIETAGTPLENATLLRFRDRFGSRRSRVLLMASGEFDVTTATLRAAGAVFLYEIETDSVLDLMPLAAGSVLPARLRNSAPDAAGVRGGDTWRRSLIPLLAVDPAEEGGAGARLVRISQVDADVQVVREIETAWSNDAERADFHRCAAVEFAAGRRWQSGERPRGSFQEDQVLFGDCSVETRGEFGAGAVRLVGTRTGNVVSWPLPPDWQGTVQRIYLAQRQRTVLLDIRGATPADSYAMTLDLDGNARTYPAGWTPLGWTTIDYFLLQRERDGEVAFAAGDARTGEIYDLFPENELREVLEQRRLEELARAVAAAGR